MFFLEYCSVRSHQPLQTWILRWTVLLILKIIIFHSSFVIMAFKGFTTSDCIKENMMLRCFNKNRLLYYFIFHICICNNYFLIWTFLGFIMPVFKGFSVSVSIKHPRPGILPNFENFIYMKQECITPTLNKLLYCWSWWHIWKNWIIPPNLCLVQFFKTKFSVHSKSP